MKGLAGSFFFAAAFVAGMSCTYAQAPSDVLKRDYFQAALRQEAESPANSVPAPIVFLGDSITANLHPELHIRGAVNYGVPGDTTPGVLYRMRRLAAVRTADVIVIQGGINDLGFGVEFDRGTVENFRTMIAEVPAKVRLIVIGLIPVDERANRELAGYNARRRAINLSLASSCLNRPRCRFLDGSDLADDTGNLSLRFRNQGDGIHLNAAGYAAMLAELRKNYVE